MTNNCTGPQRLSAYYAGGGIIPYGTVGFPYGTRTNVPVTGRIAISNFYGASYDAGQFINGDFEITLGITEDLVKYNLVGWTVLKQSIRMNGAGQIASCFTPQVSAPTPAPPAGLTSPGDNVTFSTDITNNPGYRMRLLDITDPLYASLAPPGSTGSYIMELKCSGVFGGTVSPSNPNAYGIMRGPILVCANTLLLADGDQISFQWRANKDPQGDNFAVFIYLLRVTDCATITLLNASGANTGWATVTHTITANQAGQYRFVAVHGSYDSAGGLKVGAYLYLDNITLTKAASIVLPGGQTTTTSSTTTTTTQSYIYNGDEELYVTPGTFVNTSSVAQGDIYRYQVSVFDSCTFGMRRAKPAVTTGGVPPIIIEGVSGLDQTGNPWLPGQSFGVSPLGGNGLYNEINAIGEFKYPYTNLTFGLGAVCKATVDGGGNGKYKAIEIQVTSPISVSADTASTVSQVASYTGSTYDPTTKVMFEGDQITFTVRDTRNNTGILDWRMRGIGFSTDASTFFQGGTSGTYTLTGQVAMTSGLGSLTIASIPNSTPHGNRTLVIDILNPVNGVAVASTQIAFLDKPYTGQVEFTTPGTFTWTVPTGVYSVSVVSIGGGGGGAFGSSGAGGAGGNLQWRNALAVVPGTIYTVVVGAGGTGGNATVTNGGAGGLSLFGLTDSISTANVAAYGGNGGTTTSAGTAGVLHTPSDSSVVNVGYGGAGSISGSGGGAGGYTGNGGAAHNSTGQNGSGGAGGGGASDGASVDGALGGGVGILGQGANGVGGSFILVTPKDGGPGSGGNGKQYGGGGGRKVAPATEAHSGGSGAVRIIWGPNRQFPSTNTGNLPTVS